MPKWKGLDTQDYIPYASIPTESENKQMCRRRQFGAGVRLTEPKGTSGQWKGYFPVMVVRTRKTLYTGNRCSYCVGTRPTKVMEMAC